jgi:xylulokinase
MSLMGIDAGTTGCKAAVFALDGKLLASAYAEYDVQRPNPGWAELNSQQVWEKIKWVIQQVSPAGISDPISALAVSSMGEAFVPVKTEHRPRPSSKNSLVSSFHETLPLGPSILNFDVRGEEYVSGLRAAMSEEKLYQINGNTLGNHYSLTKLMWLQEHQPDLCREAESFLHWSGFITYMLCGEAVVDYTLANRTLLFDISQQDWSYELLDWAGIERSQLPTPVASGTVIGKIATHIAQELGLPPDVKIVAGAHDQCANAVGCGVIAESQAVFGMGTFHCITPVFTARREPAVMIQRGLNTEHHAVPGKFVSFIYNNGGNIVKWYRDTFAAADRRLALESGNDIYAHLFAEIPSEPSKVLVLPHFDLTGPPAFIGDSYGVIAGLRLQTQRGEILKGIIECIAFYLKECVDSLPGTGIDIQAFRAAGGGSKADAWIQICADIFNQPFERPHITEAGALGAAIIAGVGSGTFSSYEESVHAMVMIERVFEPNPKRNMLYQERYALYRQLWPLMANFLRSLT